MSDTANNTFHFELVSPAKKLIEEPAFQVVLPGEAGDVGVRKGHASLVVSARPGVVEILRAQNGTPERLFIAGGFADITAEQTTLLAEEAIPVAELDRDLLTTEQHLAQRAKGVRGNFEVWEADELHESCCKVGIEQQLDELCLADELLRAWISKDPRECCGGLRS